MTMTSRWRDDVTITMTGRWRADDVTWCAMTWQDVPQTLSWEDCMQSVLNAAARLISIRRMFDHITPVLRDQLHWLPIRQRIDFKIPVFVYNVLHGRGPTYLSRTCNPVREVGARAHLRSAIRGDLTVPRTRTRRFGPRSFRVSGPVVWNSLPEDIWTPELLLERFKSMLKTHLFHHAYAYISAHTVLLWLGWGALNKCVVHLHSH